MSETKRIAAQLHHACHGPAWHGPALAEVLAGVTAAAAAQHPIAGAHNIWEIVLHITVWISVATQRLAGSEIPTLAPDEDWPAPPPPSDPSWHNALEELTAAEHALEAATLKLTDDDLRNLVLGERPYPIYAMLHGVVQHNVYHAGQIALLKKVTGKPGEE